MCTSLGFETFLSPKAFLLDRGTLRGSSSTPLESVNPRCLCWREIICQRHSVGADMLSLNKWRGDNNVLYSRWLSEIVSAACTWKCPDSSACGGRIVCSLQPRREMFCLSISNRVIFAISGHLFRFFLSPLPEKCLYFPPHSVQSARSAWRLKVYTVHVTQSQHFKQVGYLKV